MLLEIRHPEKLIYPESDGKPMGENTIQVKWIISLFNGLEAAFRDRPDVFVAANLFWYPVKGDPTYSLAPDVMVVIGRPKGERSSYKQWEEGDVAPQVMFEVLSPSNTVQERDKKAEFYRQHGVEEFYEYDPYHHMLHAWVRKRKQLQPVSGVDGFVSPHLGIRFAVPDTEPMTVYGPDGKPFRSYLEILADAETHQQRAEAERRRAEQERHRADESAKRAADERQRADEAARRAEALAAKLRQLGVDPDQV